MPVYRGRTVEGAGPQLVDRVESHMCGGPPEIHVAQFREFLDYDMRAAVSAVEAPVGCVNSARWPIKIDGNRAYHEDFDAVVIDGPGHFLMMEISEQFNAHLGLIVAEMTETF